MRLRIEKVVVNGKERDRYYINERRCTKEQYDKEMAQPDIQTPFGESVSMLCKIKECHMDWEDLVPTFVEGVKYCNQCNERVHMCASWAEVEQLGRHGMCVAIRQPWTVTLGFPIV